MKKFALTFLALLSVALLPARAADSASKRADLMARVESCEAILQEFMARPETAIPKAVLARARAIVITNQFAAGFVLGVKSGYGVVMVKHADGRWGLPVLVNAGETSLGLQLGGAAVETIFVVTDEQTPRLMFNRRFNVGVDARAVMGPHSAGKESANHPIIDAPVLVYTKKSGLFAGATVKAGYLSRNDEANRLLYNTRFTMPELLYGDWVTPPTEVQPLMKLVQSLAP
ncbi:MAG: lipid-binding SYLF domain-containing protein [Opitutae bacterium]|nr:lipid-binding SYLF domain-containing protein [Opitutae bacterium]